MRPQRKHPGWKELTGYRYARRGLHNVEAGVPENWMTAFQAALEQNFAIELDVHLMADGKLAVIHDISLKRVCGADVLIEDLTAEQLKAYPLLGGNGACIPLLIELKVKGGNFMLFQAHRGVSTEYPENTIPALEAAVKQGYHVIEIDPKFTKDNVCILLHDRTLNRTCRTLSGETLSEKVQIADLSYEDLKYYDAGIFMGAQFKGTHIPLMQEALTYARQAGIALKIDNVFTTYPLELQHKLFDMVEEFGGEVGFTCGNLTAVQIVVQRFPDKKIHYDGAVDEEILLQLKSMLKDNPLTVWVPMKNELTTWVKIPTATKELCDLVKHHARLGLWIIETEQQLAEARKLGADIIETTGALKP